MYSKILVPLDGSKLSEGILPYARVLARATDLPVEILSVHDTSDKSAGDASLINREYLAEVAKSFAVADVKYTLATGDPASTIVYLAAAQPDALIAMSTHGYSGARRWLLGSVAEKVSQATHNHLLLVRPGEGEPAGEARLKTAVVPLDGSALAETVLPIVCELARRLKLELTLVGVLPHVYFAVADDLLPMGGVHMAGQKEIRAQARAAATEYLKGKTEYLRAAGVSEVSSLVIEASAGGIAAEIIDLAKRTSDNLVAMSTHGASGYGRWLMGSVTERVVRYSSDPVLVIRPRLQRPSEKNP